MDTATCSACGQHVVITVVFRYPDGHVPQLQNHGTNTAPSCSRSLTPVVPD